MLATCKGDMGKLRCFSCSAVDNGFTRLAIGFCDKMSVIAVGKENDFTGLNGVDGGRIDVSLGSIGCGLGNGTGTGLYGSFRIASIGIFEAK